MKYTRSFLLVFSIVVMFVAVPALAKDYGLPGTAPEPWNRGDPGSTYQHWQFSSPTSNTPDDYNNPYGDSPTFEFESPSNWGWNSSMPGPDGGTSTVSAWTLQTESGTGTVILHVPNNPDPNEIKYIYLQITSTKFPTVTPVGGGSDGPYTSGTWPTGVAEWQEANGWYTYNWGFTIEPNPEYEDIVIDFPYGASIDQIVVDSICTPEPATMSLLAVGGLVLLRRRRK